jgi:hypothetical protein
VIVMLAVAMALLACLCLFSLVLNYAVIRRLREHTELLTGPSRPSAADDLMHAAGTPVPTVRTTAMDGAEVTVGEGGTSTLIGFLTPDCSACGERLPEFVDRAAQLPGGAANVVAVVIGPPGRVPAVRPSRVVA